MRKILVLILTSQFLLSGYFAEASIKPGQECKVLKSTRIQKGIKYTCVNLKNRLVWNSGKKISTPPYASAKPTSSPKTSTPLPTSSKSNFSSSSPIVSKYQIGNCFMINFSDLDSDFLTSMPVSCDSQHTFEIFYVSSWPFPDDTLNVATTKLASVIAPACKGNRPKLNNGYLFEGVGFFFFDKDSWDKGEKGFVCGGFDPKPTDSSILNVYNYSVLRKNQGANKATPTPASSSTPDLSGVNLSCPTKKSYVLGEIGPGCGRIVYVAKNDEVWGKYIEVLTLGQNADFSNVLQQYKYRSGMPFFSYCQPRNNTSDTLELAGPFNTHRKIGQGRNNTEKIAKNCSPGLLDFAANLKFGGFDDWFLPSLDEAAAFDQQTVKKSRIQSDLLFACPTSSPFNYLPGGRSLLGFWVEAFEINYSMDQAVTFGIAQNLLGREICVSRYVK